VLFKGIFMIYFFYLLASFSFAYAIKESDGPWGIMAWFRNKLMTNRFVGVFFYKLLDCWHCAGTHAGWIIYLIATPCNEFSWRMFVLWALASGAFCHILSVVLEKIQRE
jgi:hypothetical protein